MNQEENNVPSDDAAIGRAFRWSLALFAIGASVGGTIFWYVTRPPESDSTDPIVVELPEDRTAAEVDPPLLPFVDITQEAGIDFVHFNGATGDKLLPETMGGGCAFLDFDNDGDQDILLVNSTYWPWDEKPEGTPPTTALYENDGTGKFTNVASERRADVQSYGMGVAIGDYDNDGDSDIFLSAVGTNTLLRNDGARFTDVTSKAGVAGESDTWSSSAGFVDYDKDGFLDLFVCNYVKWSRELDVAQDFQLTGIGRAYGPPTAFAGSNCYLYHNNGDGTFEDVSSSAGIQVKNPSTGEPLGKSLGLAPIDIDRDGWIDLIVANDTVQNFVFMNQQDGTFAEQGVNVGVAFDSQGKARGAMGIDSARFRSSDCTGVAIANFANEMTALYVCTPPNVFFTDDAIPTGLGPATRLDLSFGLFFFDADLDGRPDLLSANGHLEDEINAVQSSQQYRQPSRLFWNAGDASSTEFIPMSGSQLGAAFAKPIVGRGAAYGDIDSDGDLDVLLTQIGGPPMLLRNDQGLGRHFIRLKLKGTTSNRDGIGAWVEVKVANKTYRQQVMPTRSYLSQVEQPISIGIGTATSVDSVTVLWPDGTTSNIVGSDIVIDSETTITQ